MQRRPRWALLLILITGSCGFSNRISYRQSLEPQQTRYPKLLPSCNPIRDRNLLFPENIGGGSFVPLLSLGCRRTSTASSLWARVPSAASAATGLIVSSIFGFACEVSVLRDAGILGTLVVAAVFSNLGWAPPTHGMYDLCWTIFLPSSLALLLLGQNINSSQSSSTDSTSIYRSEIVSVGCAFAVASLGSFLGCTLSFLICRSFPDLWLSPADAAVAAGCLVASYIGGSVNFFATTRLLPIPASLLSAMAAADLFVMAIYFAWLSSALRNYRLLRLFNEDKDRLTGKSPPLVPDQLDSTIKPHEFSTPTKMMATVLSCIFAFFVVTVANRTEQVLSPIVPGTACAVIALLVTVPVRLIPSNYHVYLCMREYVAPRLAALSFHLFFAGVGLSANVGQAVESGPASLFFSTTALVIHVLVTLAICAGCNRFARPLGLRHALIASNAAIGGPATASAFAAGAGFAELTFAAALWGVVGYAIGTNVGYATGRFFSGLLRTNY